MQTTIGSVMIERRSQRSSDPTQALSYLLEAERKRLGVRAITVSNSRGAILAGAGEAQARVAAQGAKLDRGSSIRGSQVATWRVRVRGEDLLITTLGRTMSGELGEGVRRILGQMQS